jgi:hypothetical protein
MLANASSKLLLACLLFAPIITFAKNKYDWSNLQNLQRRSLKCVTLVLK